MKYCDFIKSAPKSILPSGSAIGVEQLTFLYGDVADRRHVRLE